MSNLIYTNMHAFGLHYPLIDFIFNIKSFYQQGDILVVCFWDLEIYNFEDVKYTNHLENNIAVREITSEISKFLTSLGLEHKIIFLSDAIRRINLDEKIFRLLLTCYSNITLTDLEETPTKNEYFKRRPAT